MAATEKVRAVVVMQGIKIRAALRERQEANQDVQDATRVLHDTIRSARAAGATVRQLVEWSEYSQRRVFQILKDQPEESER